jgi:hypothetical protein
MKKVKMTCVVLMLVLLQTVQAQSKQIGHRGANNEVVLDVNEQFFAETLNRYLAGYELTYLGLKNLTLDDVVGDETYNKNLNMGVEAMDKNQNRFVFWVYFTVNYNSYTRNYTFDPTGGLLGIPDGGKLTCYAENCAGGCTVLLDKRGRPLGCSPCVGPIDPAFPAKCTSELTRGGGGGNVDWGNVLSGLAEAIGKLFM